MRSCTARGCADSIPPTVPLQIRRLTPAESHQKDSCRKGRQVIGEGMRCCLIEHSRKQANQLAARCGRTGKLTRETTASNSSKSRRKTGPILRHADTVTSACVHQRDGAHTLYKHCFASKSDHCMPRSRAASIHLGRKSCQFCVQVASCSGVKCDS